MSERLVVVGNGMAGVACVEQILKHKKEFDITIFGDETHTNYNRILLSSVLAGEKDFDDIVLNGIDWYKRHNINTRLGVRIENIDSAAKTVTGADGSVTPYDKLIFATGSSAFIPPMEGTTKSGVFVFRTYDDTRQLVELSGPGIKAVVIGGGLLGLEAARGLQVQGCEVTVVHIFETLMDRQLDAIGGKYLRDKMEAMGIRVLCGRHTEALLGGSHVEKVRFKDGEEIDANLVVIAAGIRPNAELGKKAGIRVNRGIIVNDAMETSDPSIFAVGECTEHNGQLFGLVAPLLEQGKVLAATISGNRGAGFSGASPAAKLKIMGVEVFSAGNFDCSRPGVEAVRYEDAALGITKNWY